MRKRFAFLIAGAVLAFLVGVGALRAYARWLIVRRDTVPKRPVEKALFDPKKPTIFIVHGLSGSAYQEDLILRPAFERFCNVETFDLPGHGEAPPLPRSQRRVKELAEQLGEQFELRMHELGVEKVVVLGISFGGEIVRRLTIERPELFSAHVAFEAPYRGNYAPAWHRRAYKGLYYWYRATEPTLDAMARQVLIETVWDIAHNFGGIEEDDSNLYESAELLKTAEHTTLYNDRQKHAESLLDYIREILCYDGKQHIGRYDPTLPTLLIKGEKTDDAIVKTTDALYNELFPRVDIVRKVTMPNLRHQAPHRFPADFAEHVERFLAEIGLINNDSPE